MKPRAEKLRRRRQGPGDVRSDQPLPVIGYKGSERVTVWTLAGYGATYHSANSARDRDGLQQEVLENLAWKIHRIWSTDWFRNPGREIESVNKSIHAAAVAYAPVRRDQLLERATQCAYPRTRGDQEPTTDDRSAEQK